MYSLASVLAREQAIAENLFCQLERTDTPAVPPEIVEAAIDNAETRIGGTFTPGQRAAAEAICTSGRGAELVVGVAGSGKTTMLSAVTAAFEANGVEVLGSATSGQAARTLGSEANIGESRTLASLIWRLDHHQLILSDRSVVVLDEVGMTDDVDLVRLAAHVDVSGAKLVLLGDHRQLGSVGPGGALGALVARHPEAVHQLSENRRQHDPAERATLEELRNGDVATAVSWYVEHDRVHARAGREEAVQAAVDAWAADTAAGHDTALSAWRRVNVAELNTRARAWMAATGRLRGPELRCPGAAFRGGDRVVALAPLGEGSMVTSQRGVVEAVDLTTGTMVIRCSDGQQVRLGAEETNVDHLAYGYATTVHRSQGATVDRAHLFADGGGRELAYVAMSRARKSTQVWTVADDVDQAAEDLRRDWGHEHRPTWAIDTGLPSRRPSSQVDEEAFRGLGQEDRVHLAAIVGADATIAGRALRVVGPADPRSALERAHARLEQLQRARADLLAGRGTEESTEAGQAIADLREARTARRLAASTAEHGARRRDRRHAVKEEGFWAAREAEALGRVQTHVAPQVAHLDAELARCHALIGGLGAQSERHRLAADRASLRLSELDRSVLLDANLTSYRNRMDGVGSPVDGRAELGLPDRRQLHPSVHPSEPEHSPELGLGIDI